MIVDTNVLIRAERSRALTSFKQWETHGDVFISAITYSELLVGVYKADTAERRIKRAAFVEGLLEVFPVLIFDKEVARVHAQLMATLPKAMTIGAHDLIIGATAIKYGFPVLTANAEEFSRMAGLSVLAFC